jgi:phosphoribosylglycinamide formyltransferase 1
MKKTVVSFLASGRGSNFKAVAEKIINGYIPAKLGILLCDKEDAKALEIARNYGMKAFFIGPAGYASRKDHEEAIIKLLRSYKSELIVAAGYMRLLTPCFIKAYKNRIINIHPALLPSFPGIHSQEQALNYGVKITGCTTHFVDEGTDTGPIILQKAVQVLDSDTVDTLSQRILKEEHKILPESVKLFCENKIKIKGKRVIIS